MTIYILICIIYNIPNRIITERKFILFKTKKYFLIGILILFVYTDGKLGKIRKENGNSSPNVTF
jgi:hypothetical protein